MTVRNFNPHPRILSEVKNYVYTSLSYRFFCFLRFSLNCIETWVKSNRTEYYTSDGFRYNGKSELVLYIQVRFWGLPRSRMNREKTLRVIKRGVGTVRSWHCPSTYNSSFISYCNIAKYYERILSSSIKRHEDWFHRAIWRN